VNLEIINGIKNNKEEIKIEKTEKIIVKLNKKLKKLKGINSNISNKIECKIKELERFDLALDEK